MFPDGAGTLPSLHPRRLLLSTHFFNARLRMAVAAADFPAAMRVFADMRAPEVQYLSHVVELGSAIKNSRIIFSNQHAFLPHKNIYQVLGTCWSDCRQTILAIEQDPNYLQIILHFPPILCRVFHRIFLPYVNSVENKVFDRMIVRLRICHPTSSV